MENRHYVDLSSADVTTSQQCLDSNSNGWHHAYYLLQAEWHSCIVAVKMLKRSDEIAMSDFRTELDVLQKVSASRDLGSTYD